MSYSVMYNRAENGGDPYVATDFQHYVEQGYFSERDGFFYPAVRVPPSKFFLNTEKRWHPSDAAKMPKDATHVVWFPID